MAIVRGIAKHYEKRLTIDESTCMLWVASA
jgi:hypothetical protein